MNREMLAIIKKDFVGVTGNKRLFTAMLVVPLVLTVIVPSIFVFAFHFAPNDPEVQKMLEMLPAQMQSEDMGQMLLKMIVNNVLPVFFLVIPIMVSSIMAGSSFVGEKEKRTLETLFYCPLTLKQIFRAKVLASFLVSMLVSFLSLLVMFAVLETEIVILTGSILIPGITWVVVILLVSPSISLIAVTLIVRGSAKAQSVEESQQSAVFLILPIILLVAGQFTGILFVSTWIFVGIGIVCALLAGILIRKAAEKFRYETILR